MKNHLLFFLMLVFASGISYSFIQKGKIFPDLVGETLDGKTVSLPKDTKGKYTLLGMAYSKKSEDDLKTWFEPVYNKFVLKTGMFDDVYDIHLYFIPMFSGAQKLAKGKVEKNLENLEPRLKPHILMYLGEINEYKEFLKMGEKDTPYFYVLDKNGAIVWRGEGEFTQEKLDEVEDLLIE